MGNIVAKVGTKKKDGEERRRSIFIRKSKRRPAKRAAQEEKKLNEDIEAAFTASLPEHARLAKDPSLADQAKVLANSHQLLREEFRELEQFVSQNFTKIPTIGKLEENRAHNRYTDIGGQ